MSITRRSFGGLMGASFGMVALRALHFLKIVMLTLRMAWPAVTPKGPGYTLDQSDSGRWVRSGPRRRVAGGSG